MNKKLKWLVLVGILILSIPFLVVAKIPDIMNKKQNDVSQKETTVKSVKYVALGDSLAAGTTPFGGKDLGYPDYLAKHFEQANIKVDYRNYAVPGYISDQLLEDVLNKEHIRSELESAEVITIDIGGNDLLNSLDDNSNGNTVPMAMERFQGNFGRILQTIDSINPKANVFVMGYFNPFPYLPKEEQITLLPLLKELNNKLEMLSKDTGDYYIPTYNTVAKKYEEYLPNKGDVHLSKKGYEAIANEFWKFIVKSKIY